jgi:hypothetical protein
MYWKYLAATMETRNMPNWGEGATQDYAIIVYVVDGWILAAIDERIEPHPNWEAMKNYGYSKQVADILEIEETPVCPNWRSINFGPGITPLPESH